MYSIRMSLVYFVNVYQLKLITSSTSNLSSEENCSHGKKSSADSHGSCRPPMFVIDNSPTHDVLKILSNFLANIETRKKVG